MFTYGREASSVVRRMVLPEGDSGAPKSRAEMNCDEMSP